MTVIAHISDLHFGREVRNVAEGLLKALEKARPGMIVVTGDLTQRATSSQYRQVRRFLSRLPPPLLVVPGNHDISVHNPLERLWFPWQKWRRTISFNLEATVTGDGCIAAGVNSVRRMSFSLDWSRGRIRPDQADRIRELLAPAPPDLIRIVAVHHPFWLPDSRMKRHLIGGRRYALKAFRDAGADLILGGHIHVPFTRIIHTMIISHAGSAISSRLDPGMANSFSLISGDRNHLLIRQMSWNGRRFEPAADQAFERTAKGWATQVPDNKPGNQKPLKSRPYSIDDPI